METVRGLKKPGYITPRPVLCISIGHVCVCFVCWLFLQACTMMLHLCGVKGKCCTGGMGREMVQAM